VKEISEQLDATTINSRSPSQSGPMKKERQQSSVYPENKISYLFFRGEVVYNVKQFSDLLGCLALDHVGDSFAAHVAVRNIRIQK
jgi:hypothetical protein